MFILEKAIFEQALVGARAPIIQAIQALRGIALTTAVTMVAEIGSFAYKHLVNQGGKHKNIAIGAVARELVGFVWDIARIAEEGSSMLS